ncbi:MAG TPA: fumarylacetoacetase, partial [Patescibacteria group bacterium]|nr:fumarylacetoacetase [Patescibacteria group bacterium]
MSASLDETHDPALKSWVESASDPKTDFPIQNLPFGRFRRTGQAPWSIGAAIGDQVLDLKRAQLIDTGDMNMLMQSAPAARRELRSAISQSLRQDSARRDALRSCLVPQANVELG